MAEVDSDEDRPPLRRPRRPRKKVWGDDEEDSLQSDSDTDSSSDKERLRRCDELRDQLLGGLPTKKEGASEESKPAGKTESGKGKGKNGRGKQWKDAGKGKPGKDDKKGVASDSSSSDSNPKDKGRSKGRAGKKGAKTLLAERALAEAVGKGMRRTVRCPGASSGKSAEKGNLSMSRGKGAERRSRSMPAKRHTALAANQEADWWEDDWLQSPWHVDSSSSRRKPKRLQGKGQGNWPRADGYERASGWLDPTHDIDWNGESESWWYGEEYCDRSDWTHHQSWLHSEAFSDWRDEPWRADWQYEDESWPPKKQGYRGQYQNEGWSADWQYQGVRSKGVGKAKSGKGCEGKAETQTKARGKGSESPAGASYVRQSVSERSFLRGLENDVGAPNSISGRRFLGDEDEEDVALRDIRPNPSETRYTLPNKALPKALRQEDPPAASRQEQKEMRRINQGMSPGRRLHTGMSPERGSYPGDGQAWMSLAGDGQSWMSERRIYHGDGQAYTWPEFRLHFTNVWTKAEAEAIWKRCDAAGCQTSADRLRHHPWADMLEEDARAYKDVQRVRHGKGMEKGYHGSFRRSSPSRKGHSRKSRWCESERGA